MSTTPVRTATHERTLQDLGSRFGTEVDGVRLAPQTAAPLSEGQVVVLGNGATRLRVATQLITVCTSQLRQVS